MQAAERNSQGRGRKKEDDAKYLEQRNLKIHLFLAREDWLKTALRKAKQDPPQSIAVEFDQIEALDKKIQELELEIRLSNKQKKEDVDDEKLQVLDDYAYFRSSEATRTVTIPLKKTARTDKLNVRRDGKLLTPLPHMDAHYDYFEITL